MRYFFYFTLFLFSLQSGYAQQLDLDSLRKAYQNSSVDTVQINILFKIASFHAAARSTRELEKTLNEIIEKSKKNGFDKTLLRAHEDFSKYYLASSDYKNSQIWAEKGLEIAEKRNDDYFRLQFYIVLSVISSDQADYHASYEYSYKVLKLAEKLNIHEKIAETLISIGVIHGHLRELDKAKAYNLRAGQLAKEKGISRILSQSFSNLGVIHAMHNQYDSALFYFKKSAEIQEKINKYGSLCISYMNIAGIYRERNEYENALLYLNKAEQINEKENNSSIGLAILRNKTHLFLTNAQYEQCIEIGSKGLDKAKELKLLSEVQSFSKNISNAHYQLGDYRKAYDYLIESNLYKDSIFSVNKSKAIADLESRMELEKKEKDFILLAKDNALNKLSAEKKDRELQIAIKHAEADRLLAMANAEKDKRTQDSLLNISQKIRLEAENLQIQQEKQEMVLVAEREQQLRVQNMYLGIVSTFIIVMILIGIGFRQKQKANKQLAKQNVEIIAQKKEIDRNNASLVQANEELSQQHEELIVLSENLELQKVTIEKTYSELISTTDQLNKSIYYASHIQSVVMPEKAELLNFFSDLFVIFRPRDIVSGDFYWFSQISPECGVFCMADCTGHGVPGAFMSMLGATILHDCVNNKNMYNDPAAVLSFLHNNIFKILKQYEQKNSDGMDIAMGVFKKQTTNDTIELTFAAAKATMSLYINGEIVDLKGDKHYVGGQVLKDVFTNQVLTVPSNSTFYFYTDGFQDQNNSARKKIGRKAFKELLVTIANMPLDAQRKSLEAYLDGHQQKEAQRDDISVIGLRLG